MVGGGHAAAQLVPWLVFHCEALPGMDGRVPMGPREDRMRTLVLTAFASFLGAAAPVMAEDFSDPTWPCVQRKVETLSLGLMWPIALPEGEVEDPALAAGIRDLAGTLAVRRLEMDALRQAAEEFTDRWPEDTEANLGRAFAQTFKS